MTFGSLFSGVGGIDLGLERAGFECRWQIENDPYCNKVLAKRWPHVKRYGDITQVRGDELEPIDILAGGFPCQDLSQAGKRAGIEGTRSGLWFEFARIVGVVRPRYVLIENVPGLLVPGAMRRVVGELARLGYVGCWRSLRASEFGASHLRKRVFIVAHGKSGGLGIVRESSGRDGLSDGSHANVEHAENDHGWRGIGGTEAGVGSDGIGWRGLAVANGALAHSERPERGPDDEHEQLRRGRQQTADRPGGDCDQLADAGNGLLPKPGRGPEGRDGPRPGSEALADTQRKGLEVGNGKREQPLRQDPEPLPPGLPSFAPGPNDPRWPRILAERPDLAPALPSLHRVADGVPDWMDGAMSNRTKRLGRLGNAVVPDCAEWVGLKILEFERAYATL